MLMCDFPWGRPSSELHGLQVFTGEECAQTAPDYAVNSFVCFLLARTGNCDTLSDPPHISVA